MSAQAMKKIIKEPRPPDSGKKDTGMPSSHATGVLYWAAYCELATSLYCLEQDLVDCCNPYPPCSPLST